MNKIIGHFNPGKTIEKPRVFCILRPKITRTLLSKTYRAESAAWIKYAFMPAYDIDDSNGSARLNWKKAALLPNWRETFRKIERNSRKRNEIL